MKKSLITAIVIVIAIGGWFIYYGRESGGTNTPLTPGNETLLDNNEFDKVPALTLLDYSGNEVSLLGLGKPAIINSWATWCPFCRTELPDFVALQEEFGEDIIVIAIDRKESLERAKKYTDSINITNDLVFVLDPDDAFYNMIGGFSMPETIFVDEDGNIRFHKRGFMDLTEMRERTQTFLNNISSSSIKI